MSTLSISNDGVKRIEAWVRAVKAKEQAERDIRQSETLLANATNELGKWLVPDSDKPPLPIGEPFHIWIGDGLLQATQTNQNTFEVKWRKRPIKTTF